MRWGRCVAITWLNTLDADCTEKERDFQLMRRAYLIERAATILRRLYDKTFGPKNLIEGLKINPECKYGTFNII
ncbi:hypothetical protein RB195_017799 [Necator americanus]|uniref:NR LBD domain-containing protein n=1 Tax=Necator americanus TaxID=51031 RepID=A0ABR1C6T8_NECAM